MTLSATDIPLFVAGLLTVFCPPVAVPMYAAVTGHFPDAVQRKVAVRMFVWIAVSLVTAVWGGQFLLRALGVTLGALTLTGGLVLCMWSIPMMQGASSTERSGALARLDCGRWREFVAVPLIFPLSIGSAAVSLVITTASRFHTVADLCVISAVCVAHAGLIGLTYRYSGAWCKRLGEMGRVLVERLSGIVLTAIAFQMVAQGLRELLPGLAA